VLEIARLSDSLTDLILSLTPEDGSSIGNGAMMALSRWHVASLDPATILAHGRGQSAWKPRCDPCLILCSRHGANRAIRLSHQLSPP